MFVKTPVKARMLTKLAAFVLAVVLLVPGCGRNMNPAHEALVIPEEVYKLDIDYCGLYVWYRADDVVTDREERSRFLDICNNGRNIWGKDVNEIYIYIELPEYEQNEIADFISSAEGIDVYILSSAGIWCSPVTEDEVDEHGRIIRKTLVDGSQAWIEGVKDYQRSHPDSQFRGLHLDFEYSYLYWSADPEHYARFVRYYCDFIDRCRDELPDMEIGIDVTCAWADWEIESEEYSLEKLVERVDYVNIMAYRDKAGDVDAEDTVEHFARQWIELLKDVDKRFMIAIETSEFDGTPSQEGLVPPQPEKVTVFEERARINEHMARIADNYNQCCPELFRGEALHYYQSSIQTWQIIDRDYFSNPPEPQIMLNGRVLSEDQPAEVVTGEQAKVTVPLVRSEDFSDRKVEVKIETFKGGSEKGNQMKEVVDFLPGESIKEAVFRLTFQSAGQYDVLVTAWDIDFNTLDGKDRVTRQTHSYRSGGRGSPVILDSTILESAIKVI